MVTMDSDSSQVVWKDLWEDEVYADLTLELTVKDDPEATKHMNVHRVYLQAKSENFKSRLSQPFDIQDHGPRVQHTAAATNGGKEHRGTKRQREADEPRGPFLILTVECESVQDQAACLAALKHAYTGELPHELELNVMVCNKANLLQLPATVQACLAALCQLAAQQQLSAELSSQLLSLPNVLPEQLLGNHNSGKALLQQLRTLTASKFSDASKVMCDKQLLQDFSALAPELLLHWASLDELVTDSENTIAVLMHVWVKQNSLQQPVSKQITEQLSKLLRVRQLSFEFHLHALPKLSWYEAPSELPTEHALVRLAYERLGRKPDAASAYYWDAKRQTTKSVSIDWALSTVRIQEKWASSELQRITGPSQYYAGYMCSLEAVVGPEGDHILVGVYLDCTYCPELSSQCTEPTCAPLRIIVEAGQGGALHRTKTFNQVFHLRDGWSYENAIAHPLPIEGGLQELMAYKELPIKVTIVLVP